MMDWEVTMLLNERDSLKNSNEALKQQIDILNNMLKGFQTKPIVEDTNEYTYETSKEFDDQLKEIRRKQKTMIKNKEAMIHDTNWTIDGSSTKGNKLMKDIAKLALDSFNDYCDSLIVRLRYSGIDKAKENIANKYTKINKLLGSFCTRISDKYLFLKYDEVQLKCLFLQKKEEEKEEIRRREAEIREQLKLEEEIKKAQEKIQYEQTQFNTEIARLQEQLNNEQGNNKTIMKQLKKLQDKIAKLEEKKKDVLNRQINRKAGWVYVISNDSFEGKEVYKVGTTRRLEPLTRVAELSSASVPFKFKVNSIIFSEDCFGLETALHKALDDKRWNLANKHKEFFVCSLNEIKQEVLKHNPTATFIDNPTDDEYEITQQLINS